MRTDPVLGRGEQDFRFLEVDPLQSDTAGLSFTKKLQRGHVCFEKLNLYACRPQLVIVAEGLKTNGLGQLHKLGSMQYVGSDGRIGLGFRNAILDHISDCRTIEKKLELIALVFSVAVVKLLAQDTEASRLYFAR